VLEHVRRSADTTRQSVAQEEVEHAKFAEGVAARERDGLDQKA